MDINKRILQFIEYKGISQRSFFTKIGYSNTVSRSKNIGIEKIAKILKTFPEINAEWLLFGEGKMIKELDNMVIEPGVVYGQNYADKLIKCQERIIELQEQLSQANAEITNLRLQQKNIFEPKQKSELKSTENDTKKT